MESFKSVASTSPRRTRTCWESEPENELNEDKDKLKQELNKDGGVSDAHSFHQDGCRADVLRSVSHLSFLTCLYVLFDHSLHPRLFLKASDCIHFTLY